MAGSSKGSSRFLLLLAQWNVLVGFIESKHSQPSCKYEDWWLQYINMKLIHLGKTQKALEVVVGIEASFKRETENNAPHPSLLCTFTTFKPESIVVYWKVAHQFSTHGVVKCTNERKKKIRNMSFVLAICKVRGLFSRLCWTLGQPNFFSGVGFKLHSIFWDKRRVHIKFYVIWQPFKCATRPIEVKHYGNHISS